MRRSNSSRGQRSYLVLDAGRLPRVGVFHYTLEKSLLKARASLRLSRTETHFEIELDVRGELPFRRLEYWQRAVLPLSSEGRTTAVVETGPRRASLEWRHEIRGSTIRTQSWKSGRESTTECHVPGPKIYTALELLAALMSLDDLDAATIEPRVFCARFVSGTKLYAFEARPVATEGDRREFETKWCSLASLENLQAEILWPQEKLVKAVPLKLFFDADKSMLKRVSYIAPVLGALVLELSGVETD